MLSKNGTGVINPLQYELLGYVYYKELGDPITWKSIPNGTAYIKLMIAAKRMYLNAGLIILPYIFSSRVLRVSTRKVMAKKEIIELQNSQLYMTFKNKYNNPEMEQHFNELVGRVESSSFEIIDWDNKNHCPGEFDGKILPMISDIINEELLYYAVMA